MSKLLTESEIAALCGVSERTIRRWSTDGCPRERVDAAWAYDPSAVEAWRAEALAPAPEVAVEEMRVEADDPADDGGEPYKSARTRRERAAADLLEERAAAQRDEREGLERQLALAHGRLNTIATAFSTAVARGLGARLRASLEESGVQLEDDPEELQRALAEVARDELERGLWSVVPQPPELCGSGRRAYAAAALAFLDQHLRPALVAASEGTDEP